jgi:peptidoglycan/xylan/chitin deacetylase (PgdA/CDA1 family)
VPRRARARGITFDDDLVEHMRVAAPRLRAHGLPTTLFLCGASLERPHPFWWKGLELARERGPDPAALLPAELGAAPGEPLEALAAQRKDFDPALRPAGRGGARGRARAARRSPGAEESRALAREVDVGVHMLRHPYLPRLDDAALERGLEEGRAALEAPTGRPL